MLKSRVRPVREWPGEVRSKPRDDAGPGLTAQNA
jgi:hypothetical protein